jgi:hypothetical protein
MRHRSEEGRQLGSIRFRASHPAFARFFYQRYFRIETRGIGVPADGRYLIV